MKRLWNFLTQSRFGLLCDLAARNFQVQSLKKQLEYETLRRQNLERILSTTIHDTRDSHRCVLQRNDA